MTTWLNVTVERYDGFRLWKQAKGIKVEEGNDDEGNDIVNIILTYNNGYDETFVLKKTELESIETQLEML